MMGIQIRIPSLPKDRFMGIIYNFVLTPIWCPANRKDPSLGQIEPRSIDSIIGADV